MEQNNTTKNTQKPLSLEIAEFKRNLISCINNSHLHPSLSGLVLREVANAALAEISAYEQKEAASYENQTEETDKEE